MIGLSVWIFWVILLVLVRAIKVIQSVVNLVVTLQEHGFKLSHIVLKVVVRYSFNEVPFDFDLEASVLIDTLLLSIEGLILCLPIKTLDIYLPLISLAVSIRSLVHGLGLGYEDILIQLFSATNEGGRWPLLADIPRRREVGWTDLVLLALLSFDQ